MRYLWCTSGGNLMPSKTRQSIHLNSSLPVFWQKNGFVPHSSVMAAECLWKLARLTSLCTYWHQECHLCLFSASLHLLDNSYCHKFPSYLTRLPLSLLLDYIGGMSLSSVSAWPPHGNLRARRFQIQESIMELWRISGWPEQVKITDFVNGPAVEIECESKLQLYLEHVTWAWKEQKEDLTFTPEDQIHYSFTLL